MFGNDKNVKEFTDSLYELFVEQKLSLFKSLEIIAHEKKSRVQKSSLKIQKELQEGNSFSNALKTCSEINFDDVYVSFTAFSEITGNLSETLKFLKQRCERQEKNKTKLAEALMYPFFILILAVFVCIFIGLYSSKICDGSDFRTLLNIENIVIPLVGLFCFCILVFFLISKNLQENKLYESFLAISFLMHSGVNISDAVGAGIIITGPASKYGTLFQKAREKLEFGMDVYNAFENFKLNQNLKNAFYFAKSSGVNSDIFEKLAVRIGIDDENKKRRCLAMVEPVFIAITGLFLIVILISYLLPVMTDTSWIN